MNVITHPELSSNFPDSDHNLPAHRVARYIGDRVPQESMRALRAAGCLEVVYKSHESLTIAAYRLLFFTSVMGKHDVNMVNDGK